MVSAIFYKIAVSLFLLFVIFQLGLAAGIVPVSAAWGSNFDELTPKLRLASIFAAGVLVAFAYTIYRRATDSQPTRLVRQGAWAVTFYIILNTFGNYSSTNFFEKWVEGAATLVLSVCCIVISSSENHATAYEEVAEDAALDGEV